MNPPREYSGSFHTTIELEVQVFWYYEDGNYLRPVIDEIQVDCFNSIECKSVWVGLDSLEFQHHFRRYMEDNLYDETVKCVWDSLVDMDEERYDSNRVFEDYDWIRS